jgi:hypothetical protein
LAYKNIMRKLKEADIKFPIAQIHHGISGGYACNIFSDMYHSKSLSKSGIVDRNFGNEYFFNSDREVIGYLKKNHIAKRFIADGWSKDCIYFEIKLK